MTPLRVAIVQPLLPKYRLPVFELLARHPDLDVTVWAGDSRGSLRSMEPGAFRFRRCPQRLVGPATWQPRALRAPLECDVLILSGNVRELWLVPTMWLAQARNVPVILWTHGYSKHERRARSLVRRGVYRLADGLLFYDDQTRQRWVASGFDARRTFTAPNALDQSSIQSARRQWRDEPKLDAFCRDHGIRRGKSIVFVSRLEDDKRVELLLGAFARVRRDDPEVSLIVIGDGSARPRLEQSAHALGIGEATRFVGALYDESALAPWMMTAGVFGYPTAIGLSIFHAFGYGLPVVTSDAIAQHNPEIHALRPNVNGLLYADGDADSFAGTLRQVLCDTTVRETLAHGALNTVTAADGYTLDNMVRGMVHAIESVTARRR